MKANLDACRRTRTEVQESQRLEREIGGVFEAGETMFAAAFLATRERADELSRRVEEAEAVRAGAVEAQASARDALSKTLSDLEARERRRRELGQVIESVRVWQSKLREALAAASALAACGERLKHAGGEALEAARERVEADEGRARVREELRRAQEGYKRAAAGLADVQRGIEELHRRAGAYHQAVRRLREAEKCLGEAPLVAPAFDDRLTIARAELSVVDEERRDAATRLGDAETHRKQHAEVMQALSVLVEEDVAVERAYEVALDALKHHRDLVSLAARLPVLERDLAEARRLGARQSKARERAQALDVVLAERPGAEVVAQLLDEVEGALRDHQERAGAAEADAAAKERELKELDARRRHLTACEPEWREHAERATRIAQHLEMVVDNRASLDAARAELGQRLASMRRAESDAREAQERLLQEARELVAAGGPFPPELLKLKEQLGAELVAGSFDDVGVDQAARLEARLGGLAQALVVDDPRAAARTIAMRPNSLPEVLLVSRDTDLDQLAAAGDVAPVGDEDVAVEERAALRISRIPSDPQLGRRAREQRAANLRRDADVKARELDEFRSLRRQLDRLVSDGEALLAGHAIWLASDPAPELVTVKRAIAEGETQLRLHRTAAVQHGEAARALRPRMDGLRTLLAEAMLLDPPDHGERVSALELERVEACAASETVAARSRHAEIVDRQLATLRQVPLSEDDLARLTERVHILKSRREQLDTGIDALSYVHANVEALGWEEAQRRLADNQSLVPAIEASSARQRTSNVGRRATRPVRSSDTRRPPRGFMMSMARGA